MMENFDDLFVTEKERRENSTFHAYDKDQWIDKKKQERVEVFSLLEESTQNAVKTPEAFLDYLSIQSQFDRYSVSNCLLIAKQYPNALKLADYDTWKDNEIFVKKGETGIWLMEPGSEFTREDGSSGFHMNVKKVFDISQTSAAADGVDAKSFDIRSMIKVLMAESPVDLKVVDSLDDNRDAKYVPEDHAIYFKHGLSGDEIFKSMAINVIIAKADERGKADENIGFTAYCATYMLCHRFGVNEHDFSFNNIAPHFEGKDSKQIRAELEACRNAANEIGLSINRALDSKSKDEKHKDDGAR